MLAAVVLFGGKRQLYNYVPLEKSLGSGTFPTTLAGNLMFWLVVGLVLLFVILMLSMIVRHDRLAFVVGWAVLVLFTFLLNRNGSVLDLIFIAIGTAIFVIFPLWRYGLLVMVLIYFFSGLQNLPITTNLPRGTPPVL